MHEAFLSMGWATEELAKDYGEDLLVKIFDQGESTPYSFFVQAKSAESLARYTNKDNLIKYPLSLDHLKHWEDFWEPVFLMIWDKESDTVFWDMIQDPEIPVDSSGKKAKFFIPKDNVLNSDGLKRISNRTRNRHRRFQKEQRGADLLIERLSEALDAEISYNAQNGILYVAPRDQLPQVTFFGKAAERMQAISDRMGLPAELALEEALVTMAEIDSAMSAGQDLIVKHADGSETRYATVKEFIRAARRTEELNEKE
ncbi:DUF4365 domain-containing protein [Streptomyces sp. NPDC056227]|uniref:DUF4365 domain-containing protein n=1 Tax=Streptomyces sp. NPDC056227 TaxID=3345753 RepID=UPI0035D5AE40